ncbi:conserved hypothetical protein [Pseudomonas sp. 8BK]|uniref:hypothetical protein n=1 Tax=Pseudomonas sp. 8BK TaxID=2653164 RepID=UPI0012F2440B|nr:hypothetical protein [Pseudomonas sp. 8BK]VXC20660.1 conserved hypothetical protein [Pseudomonas sp. 8BK]
MAIYGVGSNWDGHEACITFFEERKFILGWNEASAEDLYSFISSLKVGDILYIKANRPGSRSIRVKGIGIVSKNLMSCILEGDLGYGSIKDWNSLFVHVEWAVKSDFTIDIPDNQGRLTNVRAATLYEEHLPFVQEQIVKHLLKL